MTGDSQTEPTTVFVAMYQFYDSDRVVHTAVHSLHRSEAGAEEELRVLRESTMWQRQGMKSGTWVEEEVVLP